MRQIAEAKANHTDIEATLRLIRDEQGFVIREGFFIRSLNQKKLSIHRLYEARKVGQWGEPKPLKDKQEALKRFEQEVKNHGAQYV